MDTTSTSSRPTSATDASDTAAVIEALVGLGYTEAAHCDVCQAPLREAVRRFQRDEGLIATGDLDTATREALSDALESRRAPP